MARTVLEDADNPFLADFYNERPGAALQAQLFFLLNRHRQLAGLRQADLFQHTIVCDYLFDRDKIFAYLNLDDNELFIYQRLLRSAGARHPLAGSRRLSAGARPTSCCAASKRQPVDPERPDSAARCRVPARAERGVSALLLSLHRDAAAGRRDLAVRSGDERRALDDLVRQINGMGKGTRYYVPRTKD